MPRAGLDADRVVDAAARIADAEGLDAVSLARVAAALGVRPPSLYNHVEGHGGLLRRLAVRGVRELTAALRDAAVGSLGRGRPRRHGGRLPRVRARPPGALRGQRRRAGAGRPRAPGGRAGDGRRRLRRAARLEPRGRRRGPRRARLPQRGPRLRGAGGRRAASGSRSTSTSPSSASWRRWPAGSLQVDDRQVGAPAHQRLGDQPPVTAGGVGLQAQQGGRGAPGSSAARASRSSAAVASTWRR